jgi:LmbE family N-acetylglucosaminyl deacetylase
MGTTNNNNLNNILVIVAHPDDPEFFCGGTIARWVAEGCHVRYVIVTGGNKGSDVVDMTSDKLVALRRDEQRAAGRALGIAEADFVFLSYIDGELVNSLALQKDLVREIRRHKADVLVTTDPQTLHYGAARVNHNDHRMIGMAVCDAVFPAANNRMYFPELLGEGFAMHAPKAIYFAGPVAPNCFVDVGAFLDAKVEAICRHVSQVKDPSGLEARMRQGLLRLRADGSTYFAEAFRRVLL